MITSIKYTNAENTAILIDGNESTGLSAPNDWDSIGDGPTREAVLAWIAAGNVPEPYQPPPTPNVTTVFKLAFVEWCETNNRLNDLLTLLNSDAILKFKWDAASSLEITNPLVQGAALQLQLDAQAVFNEIG